MNRRQCIAVLHVLVLPVLLSAQVSSTNADDQTGIDWSRLDPRLHAVVSQELPGPLKPAAMAEAPRVEPLAVDAAGEPVYGLIVYTQQAGVLRTEGIPVHSVLPNFITTRVTSAELVRLARSNAVEYVTPEIDKHILNDVAVGSVGADLLHAGYVNNTVYTGEDVLVCIIDTGIDWEHLDFRDPADPLQSRILYIWDQTLDSTLGDVRPSGFSYGVEYTQSQIEDEIDGLPAGFVRETDTNGHGTHVAGTAAGNGASLTTGKYSGMAPDADILVVKAGNGSFPTSYIIDGLTWAQNKATALGKPVVVNMSLGSNYGPHDGTDSKSQAVDAFCSSSGQVVVVSAGNDGDSDIHKQGTIPNTDYHDFTFTVPTYTPTSEEDNDDFGFDVWFDGSGSVTATVTTPNSHTAVQGPGSSTTPTADGAIYINNSTDINNGDRHVQVWVFDDNGSPTPADGTWTIRLTNNSGGDFDYHGWLYDSQIGSDSPVEIVTLSGGDSNYTLSNTADEEIIVGSYVHRWRWSNNTGSTYWYGTPDRSDDISDFSSIGPTRTESQRPDITAPGQGVVSTLSQDDTPLASRIMPGGKHQLMQGTSMSSPVVTGAVALLLQQNAAQTAGNIKSLLLGNADTDSYTGTVWNDTWGYGRLNIYKTMVAAVNPAATAEREVATYDGWSSNSTWTINPGDLFALPFTPSISCKVTGLFIHPYTPITLTGPLYLEIWSDNSGTPGTKLGSTVSVDYDALLPDSWNFVNMIDAGVSITSGTDYHVVAYYSSGTEMDMLLGNSIDGDRAFLNTGGGWGYFSGYAWRMRPVISTDEDILVEAKIFLEGPYDDGSNEMTTSLNSSGYIPTTSPYSADERSVASIPADVTDWVLVQLRTATDGSAVASKSAFLHKDGRIVADDGTTGQITMNAPADDYYIVLLHRNHLAVMSAGTVALSSGSSSQYDFTGGLSQFHNNQAAFLETGVYGMYSGDTDGSGTVDANDRSGAWNDRNLTGYQDCDCGLTCTVDANDRSTTWNNRNLSTQVQNL